MKRYCLAGLAMLGLIMVLGGGCRPDAEAGLSLSLKDVYYEKHYYRNTTVEVLVVNMLLENNSEQSLTLSPASLRDDDGLNYTAPLFPSRNLPEGECCKGIKSIVELEAGQQTDSYLMVYEPVPANATGLEVTLSTDDPDAEPVVLELPDADLIRIKEFFDTATS